MRDCPLSYFWEGRQGNEKTEHAAFPLISYPATLLRKILFSKPPRARFLARHCSSTSSKVCPWLFAKACKTSRMSASSSSVLSVRYSRLLPEVFHAGWRRRPPCPSSNDSPFLTLLTRDRRVLASFMPSSSVSWRYDLPPCKYCRTASSLNS